MFTTITRTSLVLSLGGALLLTGCGDGDSDDDDNNNNDPQPTTQTMSLSFTGLEDLGSTAVYEGWLIDAGGAAHSTGTFSIAADSSPQTADFTVAASLAAEATTFVLTIEPATDPDPAPAATHVLAGPVSAGSAALSVDHAAAIGTDFSTASGSFFLATPTSAATDDANQGIWYIASGAAGLDLPTLPAGWAYEGWVVVDGAPVSTGTFTDPAMADSDGAGSTAGPLAAPPFPGQDFITPPTDLIGATAVISVEPVPDNSPAPFTLKPLLVPITDAGAMVDQPLMANTAPLPAGTVVLASPGGDS